MPQQSSCKFEQFKKSFWIWCMKFVGSVSNRVGKKTVIILPPHLRVCYQSTIRRQKTQGTTINAWGGGNREQKLKGPSPGKKNQKGFPQEQKIGQKWRGYRQEKMKQLDVDVSPPASVLILNQCKWQMAGLSNEPLVTPIYANFHQFHRCR